MLNACSATTPLQGTDPNEAEILMYGGEMEHASVPLFVSSWCVAQDQYALCIVSAASNPYQAPPGRSTQAAPQQQRLRGLAELHACSHLHQGASSALPDVDTGSASSRTAVA
jgi:hypothetical protein